jgi:transposase
MLSWQLASLAALPMLIAMVTTTSKRLPPSRRPGQDGRRLSRAQLIKQRKTAVRWVLAGKRPSDVLRKLGLSRAWLAHWLDLYRQKGGAAFARPARGTRPSLLTPQEFTRLLHTAIQHDLRPGNTASPLWSCEALATRLHRARRLRSLVVTLRKQLARVGIAAPVAPWHEKARQALPVTVQSWLATEFASVQREARRAKVPTWFVKQVSVKSLTVPAHFKEFGALQVWLAVGGRGEFRFMFARDGGPSDVLSAFLHRLLAARPQPAVVILNRVRKPVVVRLRWPKRHSVMAVEGGGVDTLMRL